jgi:hypothetical protein
MAECCLVKAAELDSGDRKHEYLPAMNRLLPVRCEWNNALRWLDNNTTASRIRMHLSRLPFTTIGRILKTERVIVHSRHTVSFYSPLVIEC